MWIKHIDLFFTIVKCLIRFRIKYKRWMTGTVATTRIFFSVQDPTVCVAQRHRSDRRIAPSHAVHTRHRRSGLRDRGAGQTMGGTAQPSSVRAGPRRRPRCRSAWSSLSVRACHVQGLLQLPCHEILSYAMSCNTHRPSNFSYFCRYIRKSVNARWVLLGHPII